MFEIAGGIILAVLFLWLLPIILPFVLIGLFLLLVAGIVWFVWENLSWENLAGVLVFIGFYLALLIIACVCGYLKGLVSRLWKKEWKKYSSSKHLFCILGISLLITLSSCSQWYWVSDTQSIHESLK